MSEQNGQPGTYDPATNARSLTSVPDQSDLDNLEKRAVKLRQSISRYEQMLTVFRNPQWKLVDTELGSEIQRGVNALADPKVVNNVSVLAYVQGEIEAFTKLKQLPHLLMARREIDVQELRDITEELEQYRQ